jgi:predicted ATPase
MEIARRLGDPALEMHVLETQGTVAFWRGEHDVALRALRGALERYDAPRGRAIRLMYGTDSRVVAEAYVALALWYGGDATGARASARAAVDHARDLADVHSLALALVFSAIVHLNRGELEEARRQADEAVARSTEQHLEQWLGSALFVSGLVLVRLGRADDAFAALAQGSQVYGSVGATVGGRYFAAGLGEAFLLAGRPQEGLTALTMMGTMLPAGDDTCHDADLARVQGELVLAANDDVAGAAAAFQHGLTLARSQGARSLELRSAIALARLHLRQQRPDEARALLQPLRPLFESGDPTTDARAASELFALALR